MAWKITNVDKNNEIQPVIIHRHKGQYGPYYTVSVAQKDKDGNWKNSYPVAKFDKNVEFEDKEQIFIRDASLTPTNDKYKVAIRVWKFDYNTGFRQMDEDLPY